MKDNEKARKIAPIFKCEKCDVICSKISDYDRHLLTRKHRRITEDNEKAHKSASLLKCEICDVICSRKSEYERHILTRKHLRITEDSEKMRKSAESAPKNAKAQYPCNCGKVYKYNSGLCKHKKICRFIANNKPAPIELSMDDLTNAGVSTYSNTHRIVPSYNPHPEIQSSETIKIIMDIMKENQEFKNMMIEQHKTMLEIMQNSQQIVIANSTITTNSNNNNTNSHNKQFNLHYFLNEQCKNAINLTDFVNDLQLDFNDLENVADQGYVEGITQIFMNGLKKLDIYKRPVHCTDVKRESVHVRENNIWIKDTHDQSKIKAAIRRIAFRNVQQISKWNKEHPECRTLDTNEFNRSFQIMKQSLGNTVPGGVEQNNEKIARNILKAIYLDKKDPLVVCM